MVEVWGSAQGSDSAGDAKVGHTTASIANDKRL